MSIFSGDKSIYGQYAAIIKKYSKSTDADAEEWKVTNGENSPQTAKIFATYIDCLYAAAAIGLEKNVKVKDDNLFPDKKIRANILAGAWKNRQVDFEYLYRLMILTDSELSISDDARAKKVCTDIPEDRAEDEFKYFLRYACGGLLEMDKMFSGITDYVGVSNLISSIYCELTNEE